jgi:hypothetical protein
MLALIFGQASTVLAAPAQKNVTQATMLTGTITAITIQTDSLTGLTTIAVTFTDAGGLQQTVNISVETAVTLGLVTIDPISGTVAVVTTMIGQPITIDPAKVLSGLTENPVAAAIAEYFKIDYAAIEALHADGFGYGVIAQACYLSTELTGNASLCGSILTAKQSGDFSKITLPDGSTVTNWGQLKKVVMDKGHPKNLGAIVSGKAQGAGAGQAADKSNNGNDNKNDKGNNGKNEGKGKGKGNNGNNGNNNKP